MITIVVLLTVRDRAAFDRFERQAVSIMADHGGRLDAAFRPQAPASEQTPRVDEVHVLKFSSPEAFARYRADDRLAALAALRDEAIAHTTVYVAEKAIDYPPPKTR